MNRAARRRGDLGKHRKQLIWLLIGAVAILFVAGGVVFALTRGDDDTPTPAGTRGGAEPVLAGPAVKYAASQDEIGGGIEAVPNESTDLSADLFADPSLGPFIDSTEGKAKASEWGYVEGYIGSFQPDGLTAGVVLGRYYVRLETHLFGSAEGAQAAYEWYVDRFGSNPAVAEEDTAPLGNDSSGWRGVLGKVGTTELDRVFHRFIFRRGNLVAMVETIGADTFMTIDPAREVAVVVDDRALGNRAASTPTPSGGALPAAPTPVQ